MLSDRWAKVVIFLLLGYLCMGRSFAYLGISPLKVFIGELALAAFMLLRGRESIGLWMMALTKPTLLSGVAWGLFLFLGYGVFQLLQGILLGHSSLVALQNLVFNSYPFYFFMGLWVGQQRPGFLVEFIRVLAWANGLYGMAYLFALSATAWVIPGSSDVPLFGQPGGSAVAILGLLALEPNLAKAWPLLLLNSFVLLGVQVRAEWLGLLSGAFLWGCLTGRLKRLAVGGMAMIALLSVLYLTEVNLPVPRGSVSVREFVARVLAPLNTELAAQYSDEAVSYAGTVSWRTTWWRAMWDSVHESLYRALIGHGYGMPVGDLVPYLAGEKIRTPHNVFFYALIYGGWLGVGAFVFLQLMLVQLLWRVYLYSGLPFGLAYWAMGLTAAFFSNFFETPFGAIPFYLLLGLSLTTAMGSISVDAGQERQAPGCIQGIDTRTPAVPA